MISMHKIQNTIFYNHLHSGDVHLSRSLVRYAIKNIDSQKFYYCHPNRPEVLKDMPQVTYLYGEIPEPMAYDGWTLKGRDLWCNTWYSAYHKQEYQGCTMQTLFNIFRRGLRETVGIELPLSPVDYLPEIDFNHIDLYGHIAKRFFGTIRPELEYKIMISNCDCLSGQSDNFNFNPIIEYLADAFRCANFYITNKETRDVKETISRNNVFYMSDIIQQEGCDLNEISYLSTFCNMIIGRGSGPQTFSITKRNLNDPDKIFVFLTKEDFGVAEKVSAKISKYENFKISQVPIILKNEIKRGLSKW